MNAPRSHGKLLPVFDTSATIIERQRSFLWHWAVRMQRWLRPSITSCNQDPTKFARTRKRIIICADGTWQKPKTNPDGIRASTNVYCIYTQIKKVDSTGVPQIAYYHAGVGTGDTFDRIVGGATGWGLNRNIRECYQFLFEHYEPGDSVYLFGFSRGAYTVRSLAGFIRNCGILDRRKFRSPQSLEEAITNAFEYYRERDDTTAPAAQKSFRLRRQYSRPDFRITCIGVWDTVGALGIPLGVLGTRVHQRFHDVTLSSWVDRAFHAVAVDEMRHPFQPTLWEQQPECVTGGQRLFQRWFSGVHMDVGGGYPVQERGLADRTLKWMVDSVSSECKIEFEPASPESADTQVLPHDSMTIWYSLFGPLHRLIDASLEERGVRNRARETKEKVDPSVVQLRDALLNYRPDNVADYEKRLKQELEAGAEEPGKPPTDLRI